MNIEPVEAAGVTWFVLVDDRGYPLAQGSRELVEQSRREFEEMARPKGSGKKQKGTDLKAALDFVSVAVTEHTTEHWRGSLQFKDGMMLAYDGILAAGVKAIEDFTACPHYGHFKRAVEHTGAAEGASFTQLDATKLAVTAGKFKAIIPCLDPSIMPPIVPDQNIAPLTDSVREGFECIGHIVKDAGNVTMIEASILLQGQTMVATDRVLMCEYWHANDLPPGLVIPKRFINAVIAAKKKLVGFGYTQGNSCTFWFEDGSWIKTQLFSEPWPESWATILNRGNDDINNMAEVPAGFFDAVAAVAPFSDDGTVYFAGNVIRSHEMPGVGASYDFICPTGFAYSGAKLLALKDKASSLYFSAQHKCAFFFAKSPPVRSALSQRRSNPSLQTEPASEVPVPSQFQPPEQKPPQEPQGSEFEGMVGQPQPGGWATAPAAEPEAPDWGSNDDGSSADPADAWRTNTETPANEAAGGGWGATRSDVPIPE